MTRFSLSRKKSIFKTAVTNVPLITKKNGIVYEYVFQLFEFKSFVWLFVIRNSLFVSKINTQFLTIEHNLFSVGIC